MIDNCLEHTTAERRQFPWFPAGHTGILHLFIVHLAGYNLYICTFAQQALDKVNYLGSYLNIKEGVWLIVDKVARIYF